ncbi:hemerythrin domain-containing protein [Candidatus Saganbacteria bacterium]|nr:hemerythrin domain-containing protein [Candidatus Saganbacteria bacterium]
MNKYLNTGIKEIITEYPKIGTILEEYNIGCGPCTLGTCLLKDVVGIHGLSPDQELELMYRIEKEIYPDRNIKKPNLDSSIKKQKPKEFTYSPPIQRLVDEHVLIKKWLALMPKVLEKADLSSEDFRLIIADGVAFIRNYADKFHHAKEEDVLFDYTDKNAEIVKIIFKDHDTARGYVKAAINALENNNKDALIQNLLSYKELLTEHIRKEDEVLYPFIDRGLSMNQIGEMFTRFNDAEEKIDKEVVNNCIKFVNEAERRIE